MAFMTSQSPKRNHTFSVYYTPWMPLTKLFIREKDLIENKINLTLIVYIKLLKCSKGILY